MRIFQVDTIDEKLDVVLQLLRKDITGPTPGGILPGGPTGGAGHQYAYSVQNPYGVDTATPSERFDTPPFFINPHADKKNNEQLPPDLLKKKLELLHSEYNSMSGNESGFSDKGLKGKADYASHNSIEEEEFENEDEDDIKDNNDNHDDDIEEDHIPTDELFNAARVVDVDIHPSRVERAESSRERHASETHDGDERRGSAPPHVCRSNSRFTVTPSKIGPDKDMFFGDSCDAACERPRNMSQPSLETLEIVRRCSHQSNNSSSNSNCNINSPLSSNNCKHASLSSINWNNSAMGGVECNRNKNNMRTRFNSVPMLFDSSKNMCVSLNGQTGGGRNSPIVINDLAPTNRPSQPVLATADNNVRNNNGSANKINHCNGKRLPCKGRSLSTETSANSTPTLSRLFAPKDSAVDTESSPAVIPNGISESVSAEN